MKSFSFLWLASLFSVFWVPASAQIDPDCGLHGLDVAFVLDGSRSLSPGEELQAISFVNHTTEYLNIGPGPLDTRISVMWFAGEVFESQTIFFTNGTNKQRFTELLLHDTDITLQGGTDFSKALTYLASDVFKVRNDARRKSDDVPRVAIVVTDGESYPASTRALVPAAIELLLEAGVTLFAVGVGNGVKESELQLISNSTTRFFQLQDFDQLFDGIAFNLTHAACDDPVVAVDDDSDDAPPLPDDDSGATVSNQTRRIFEVVLRAGDGPQCVRFSPKRGRVQVYASATDSNPDANSSSASLVLATGESTQSLALYDPARTPQASDGFYGIKSRATGAELTAQKRDWARGQYLSWQTRMLAFNHTRDCVIQGPPLKQPSSPTTVVYLAVESDSGDAEDTVRIHKAPMRGDTIAPDCPTTTPYPATPVGPTDDCSVCEFTLSDGWNGIDPPKSADVIVANAAGSAYSVVTGGLFIGLFISACMVLTRIAILRDACLALVFKGSAATAVSGGAAAGDCDSSTTAAGTGGESRKPKRRAAPTAPGSKSSRSGPRSRHSSAAVSMPLEMTDAAVSAVEEGRGVAVGTPPARSSSVGCCGDGSRSEQLAVCGAACKVCQARLSRPWAQAEAVVLVTAAEATGAVRQRLPALLTGLLWLVSTIGLLAALTSEAPTLLAASTTAAGAIPSTAVLAHGAGLLASLRPTPALSFVAFAASGIAILATASFRHKAQVSPDMLYVSFSRMYGGRITPSQADPLDDTLYLQSLALLQILTLATLTVSALQCVWWLSHRAWQVWNDAGRAATVAARIDAGSCLSLAGKACCTGCITMLVDSVLPPHLLQPLAVECGFTSPYHCCCYPCTAQSRGKADETTTAIEGESSASASSVARGKAVSGRGLVSSFPGSSPGGGTAAGVETEEVEDDDDEGIASGDEDLAFEEAVDELRARGSSGSGTGSSGHVSTAVRTAGCCAIQSTGPKQCMPGWPTAMAALGPATAMALLLPILACLSAAEASIAGCPNHGALVVLLGYVALHLHSPPLLIAFFASLIVAHTADLAWIDANFPRPPLDSTVDSITGVPGGDFVSSLLGIGPATQLQRQALAATTAAGFIRALMIAFTGAMAIPLMIKALATVRLVWFRQGAIAAKDSDGSALYAGLLSVAKPCRFRAPFRQPHSLGPLTGGWRRSLLLRGLDLLAPWAVIVNPGRRARPLIDPEAVFQASRDKLHEQRRVAEEQAITDAAEAAQGSDDATTAPHSDRGGAARRLDTTTSSDAEHAAASLRASLARSAGSGPSTVASTGALRQRRQTARRKSMRVLMDRRKQRQALIREAKCSADVGAAMAAGGVATAIIWWLPLLTAVAGSLLTVSLQRHTGWTQHDVSSPCDLRSWWALRPSLAWSDWKPVSVSIASPPEWPIPPFWFPSHHPPIVAGAGLLVAAMAVLGGTVPLLLTGATAAAAAAAALGEWAKSTREFGDGAAESFADDGLWKAVSSPLGHGNAAYGLAVVTTLLLAFRLLLAIASSCLLVAASDEARAIWLCVRTCGRGGSKDGNVEEWSGSRTKTGRRMSTRRLGDSATADDNAGSAGARSTRRMGFRAQQVLAAAEEGDPAEESSAELSGSTPAIERDAKMSPAMRGSAAPSGSSTINPMSGMQANPMAAMQLN